MTETTPDLHPLKAPAWAWLGFPVLCLVLMAGILVSGQNEALFLVLNRVSEYTGPGIWANLTILGDGLVVAVLFLPLIGRRPDLIWAGLLAAVLSTGLHELIDHWVHAPRPPGVLEPGSFIVIGPAYRMGSFPSGHTTTLMTWAGVLALGSRSWRWAAVPFVLGLLGGFSRIAVGVHWPADVLAGWALGWGSAAAGLWMAGRFPGGQGLKTQRVVGALLLVCAVVLAVIDHTGYPGVLWFQRTLAVVCLLAGMRQYRTLWRIPAGAGGDL